MALPELSDLIAKTSARTKKELPLLKLADFGDLRTEDGSLRSDENLGLLYGVEGDYDGEEVPIVEAATRIHAAGVEALLYTSPSSTPAKPRWRVICPFSRPRLSEVHGREVDRLNGALGGILADESWTLSQTYYYGEALDNVDGEPKLILVPGARLDLACLDDAAIGRPGRARRATTAGGRGARMTTADWREIAEGEIPDKKRTLALTRFAGLLLSRGHSGDEYVNLLLQFNREKCRPPLTERKVRHTASGIERTSNRRRGR
jgi:hypothetical protein